MRLATAFFAFLLANSPAQGKCAFALYVVDGRLSLPTGVTPDDVRIYLFLEGSERASQYPGRDYAVPDADGSYRVEVRLSTLSEYTDSRGELCDRVEGEADLSIVGTGIYAHRVPVKFASARVGVPEGARTSTKVRPIELEAVTREAPE